MRTLAFGALISLCALLGSSLAQYNPISSSSDPQLVITTTNNQSTFRIGEVIGVNLAFTSASRRKYQLNMASYDRSGRLNVDKFVVEPSTGWDDPLELYFHSYAGFIGGGLAGFRTLAAEPTTIHVQLNEWIRFRTPGRYRISVTSGRVSEIGSASLTRRGVASNSLILTIVPSTRAWQESTLRNALHILDSATVASSRSSGLQDPRSEAIKNLRYLGTPEAAREMAVRLTGGNSDWDLEAGLVGSPTRSAGLEEMKMLLVSPTFPVTDRFLGTMSVLALPEDASNNAPAQRAQAEAEFRADLISAMEQKQGAAQAVSINTLVEGTAIAGHALPDELKRTVTRELVENFDKLSPQKQAELFQYRWGALDHEEMLPLLRKIAQRYRDFPQLREINAFELNNASAAALEHWYETSPDEARPVVLHEILRPKPRFNASVLGILPDSELPEVDQALVEHLVSSQDFDVSSNIASLIQRYATAAIEPQIVNFLDPVVGKLACAVQEPLLAYLLKIDSEAARPRLDQAMAARGQGFFACNHSLLQGVAKLHDDKMLQDLAIRSLDDPDPQVVEDAATYLGTFGSASAEQVLWAHLISWSERWKGREKELQYVPDQKMDGVYEAGAGSKLVSAIATGHAWLVDDAKLRRLIDLSVAAGQRQQAEQFLRQWQTRPWSILLIGDNQFQIAQYDEISLARAEEKLQQFPAGSTFQWVGPDTQGKYFGKISSFAAEHGLKLVSQPHQD
jgi:hypothetical protein